jgi:diacylglycerol kinase family enzyme
VRGAGFSPEYCSTKEKGFAEALARDTDLIVVAGGDGTVARVATEVAGREAPIAIIPLGTANNVARSFGIVGALEEIVASWETATRHPLDIGVAEGGWGRSRFIEGLGLGVLAEATSRKVASKGTRAKQLQRGRDAFRKALAKAEPIPVELSLDERLVTGEMLLVEILNTSLVGPGLCLAPFANPGDSRLDVALLPVERREAMLEWLVDPEQGTLPPIVMETARRVVIGRSDAAVRVGDAFPSKSGKREILVELEPASAAILVPSFGVHGGNGEVTE